MHVLGNSHSKVQETILWVQQGSGALAFSPLRNNSWLRFSSSLSHGILKAKLKMLSINLYMRIFYMPLTSENQVCFIKKKGENQREYDNRNKIVPKTNIGYALLETGLCLRNKVRQCCWSSGKGPGPVSDKLADHVQEP